MKASISTADVTGSAHPALELSRPLDYGYSMIDRAARSLFLLAAFVGLLGSDMLSAPCATAVHLPESSAVLSGGSSHGSTDSHSMPEMAVPSLPHESGRGVPCEHDSMPEGCMLMAACTAFVPAVATQLNEPVAPSGKGMVLVVRTPAFESVAPDVPPPRIVQPTT